MIKSIKILLIATLSVTSLFAQDKMDIHALAGAWMGKLNINSITLRIVFNLSVGGDSLAATLDSPDQGARGIPMGKVEFDGSKIKIPAPTIGGLYEGTVKNDTLIGGTWTQMGNTLPLELAKLDKPFTLSRPQEPRSPFPYLTENVKFKNNKAGIELGGTLTIPKGDGPFPAVVLITGSGAQNRDEELLGHKPFSVIADYLTRKGIAVLRYDDRGVGESQGNYASATSADLATDALAAFEFLNRDLRIDPQLIGLAGHSEGGLIAPIVAASDRRIGFIVSLAGPGVSGEDLINRQNSDISLASGIDPKKVKESIAVNKELFAVLKKEPDNKIAETKIIALYRKILASRKTSPEDTEKALKQLNAGLNPLAYTWFRYFLSTDPAIFWKKVKCPVLALNGDRDLQVAADPNLAAIGNALKSGGNTLFRSYKMPGLNHLFQHCTTGLPSEYGEIEESFSPEVLKIISDWILALETGRPAF
ncbi:MAG: alpha/beta hydrolase [Bacteroidales bacterium]